MLYDEFGNDDIKLNMFSATFEADQGYADETKDSKANGSLDAASDSDSDIYAERKHEDLNPGEEYYY